jgi:hypothetical protein
MPSDRRRDTVSARVLRPVDLLDLQVTAVGAKVDRSAGGPVLVAGDRAHLVVELAFQHLGEEAWPESLFSPAPSGIARHRAARPSRLVYELAPGTEIPWTATGLLEAIPRLRLLVVPLATPGPASYPEDDSPGSGAPGARFPWVFELRPQGELILRGARPVNDVVAAARAIRLARGLERTGAGRLSSDHPLADAVLGRRRIAAPPVLRPRSRPRAPHAEETALEVPYRLIVSPSADHGAFVHPTEPLTAMDDETRVQLWSTRLTARIVDEDGNLVGYDDEGVQRIVRAVWSPDLLPPDTTTDADVALMSTSPVDRRTLVRQSSAVHEGVTPVPFRVRRLHLTALGATVDWRGAWDTYQWKSLSGWGGTITKIASYRHVTATGRDTYVRVTYPGFLFPFGHRAELVKLTERKVDEKTRTAYLRQRHFIVLRETVRSWGDRDTPLTQVLLEPLVTPDLDPVPKNPNEAFVPRRGGAPLPWDIHGVDRVGDPVTLSAPLLFVPDAAIDKKREEGSSPADIEQDISTAYGPHRVVGARGQPVSFAAAAEYGDTRLEANSLTWDGHVDVDAYTSRPFLIRANAVAPSLRHLAGQAPGIDVVFAPAYLAPDPEGDTALGFGSANPSGLFLVLDDPPVSLDFTTGSDRAGGFVTPNLMVRALSRSLGAVGDDGTTAGGLQDGRFAAATFLQGALPKLFGLFDLVELLQAVAGADALDLAPEFVTDALDTVNALVREVERLRAAATEAQQRLDDDLADAVLNGAHQGAQDAIAAAKAELDAAVGPLAPRLDAVVTAVGGLLGDPGGVPAAQVAVTDLTGSLGDLRAALDHPRLPAAVRAQVQKPLEALDVLLAAADLLQAVADFAANILSPADGVRARFEWRPKIGSWPNDASPVFHAKDADGFGLSVEVRASAQGAPSIDVSAELRNFALVLLPGEPLMAMNFSRIGFHVGSATKPEVDVVFDGMEFLGALGFIETLRRMIPFDGFADPPYVDVTPAGATAGFDLELPNVAVGVFSLENIQLGADARVPFLGDAVTVGFRFCSKESPFRLTVMCIGGGGWVALRLSPMGMVELEMGLEAAASLSIDLGVASGSVCISVGVYLRLEGDAGSLTGYFRIRGEVSVLGLISASITLELSLTYDFPTGKMVGRASIVIEIEILFFSASVEVSCERRLAGSKGDPVLADIMPPDAAGHSDAWSEYCAAFAPGA